MDFAEVVKILREFNVVPNRQLGQNFLVDERSAMLTVESLDLQPEDVVVEVGAGTGSLSKHLLGKVKRIILIEYDNRLADFLKKYFAEENSVEVVIADACTFDCRNLFLEGNVKLLSNLPYASGAKIIRNFLQGVTPVVTAVLILQKEVGQRILATPRNKAYGAMSVQIQTLWEVALIKELKAKDFYPKPQVESWVLSLKKKVSQYPAHNPLLLDRILRCGFSQRRKQLKKLLPNNLDWEKAQIDLALLPTVRAEELSVMQWVFLARFYEGIAEETEEAIELLDVVDKNNQVIRQLERGEVHSQGLAHRTVHVLLFNDKGQVLLQKRALSKTAFPGLWDSSISGHVLATESYQEAVKREMFEELYLNLPFEKIGEVICGEESNQFVEVFKAEVSSVIAWNSQEIETIQWFDLAMLNHWINKREKDFSKHFIKVWKTPKNSRSFPIAGHSLKFSL